MEKQDLFNQKEGLLDKPELYNLKLLLGINLFLLITDFLMPQYFGVHLGYDITCTRLANMLLAFYALLHINVFNLFTQTFIRCSISIPLIAYLFVSLYTMIFRVDINAFMLVFLEILTLYMLIFAIRYVIGCRRAIKITIYCAYFLSIYGLIEFAAGESLYLRFLRTVPTAVTNCYRSGYYRIMGPCGHPLGYGLLLILFVAIACIDLDTDEIFLFKRPVLLVLLIVNVFLTGSRSSQGIVAIEVICIIILSKRDNRKKALFYCLALALGVAIFIGITYKTRIGQYLLMQITILIDQVFDTEISANFGADIQTLKNSEGYREFLPYIFKLDWLNPILGRGVKRSFGAEIVSNSGDVVYVSSVDSYYICQYIKYAYPGLISYIGFILVTGISMIVNAIKYKSGTMTLLFIGFVCYFINLYYLDALQTLKFVYVITAIFFALVLLFKDNDIGTVSEVEE